MARSLPTLTAPVSANVPVNDIPAPAWIPVQSAALQAATRRYDPRAHGIIGTIDDSAVFQDTLYAIAGSGGGTVESPYGTWVMKSGLFLPDNVTLDLNGSTLDFSGMTTPVNASCVSSSGSLANLPALAAPVDRDDDVVTFAAPHNLATGDRFVIDNPALGSFNSNRDYYRDGQFCIVAAVLNTTEVRIQGRAYSTYPTTCTVHKLAPGTGSIVNGAIIGTTGVWGVTHMLSADFTIQDLVIDRAEAGQVQLSRCVDFSIMGVRGNSRMDAAAGNNYGLTLGNVQNGIVSHNQIKAQWHAFTTGGGSATGSVPCRDVQVSDNQLQTMGAVSAADTHGNSEHVTFSDNIVDGGFSIGGDHITVDGNTIFGGSGPMPIQTGDELLGGDIAITNNAIHVQQPGVSAGAQGFIQFYLRAALTRSGGTLKVSGNTIHTNDYTNPGSSASVIQIYNVAATGLINLDVSDNDLHTTLTAPTTPPSYWDVLVRCASGKAFDRVRIQGIRGGRGSIRGLDLNCRLLDISGIETSMCASADAAISIDDNPAPVFAAPVWTMHDLMVLGAYGQTLRLVGLPGSTLEVANATLLNGNGKGDAGASTGTNVLIDTFNIATLRGNTWGSSAATRRLYIANVTELEEMDNKTLGTMTTDTFVSVANRYVQLRQAPAPDGVTVASPGSVVVCSGNGNVYRKASGVMTSAGWTAM